MAEGVDKKQTATRRMARHHGIVACCFGITAFLAASTSSGMDLNSLIQTQGTVDRSFKFTPCKKRPKLPGTLQFYGSDDSWPLTDDIELLRVVQGFDSNFKYGFVDREGKVAIEPVFSNAEEFSEGLAGVSDASGKSGYINKRGEWVISPRYTRPGEFHEGIASVVENGKGELIDRTGRVIFKDDNVEPPNRLGHVYAAGTVERSLGLIDSNGHWLLPPVYDEITALGDSGGRWAPLMMSNWGGFSGDGYLCIKKNGLSGLVDSTGHVLIPPKFKEIKSFRNGHAVFWGKRGFGVADSSGQVVIPPKYDFITAYDNVMAVRVGRKWSLIDASGKSIEDAPQISGVNVNVGMPWISDGLGAVLIKDKFGYVNAQGKLAITPAFEWVDDFSEGRAAVWDGGNSVHFIDTSGQSIGPNFVDIAPFKNGIAQVSLGGSLHDFVHGRHIEEMKGILQSTRHEIEHR
ncbi:MAG TPA: WG repeat-containing protein [Oculatellaceae cyanobacterium]